jgi:4-azaleucine resistance transporter AzlC
MSQSQFLSGARRSIPIIFSAAPFGMLFGALAVDNGMSVFEATLMSTVVYAGASQMVGIELFGQHAAPWLIVFSIFVVNLRHVLYSAVVGRHMTGFSPLQKAVGLFFLIDPQFAESEREYERTGRLDFSWFMGMALPLFVVWIAVTAVGAVFGKLIPDPQVWGIDFLLPVYFLGLVMGFRKRPLWLPVVIVSGLVSVAAIKLVGSPWHVSIGALAGIVFAAAFAPVKKVSS